MRSLTWFWVIAVATAFVCLLLTEPAHPDDFAAHLKALQEKNAARAKAPPCPCASPADCICHPCVYPRCPNCHGEQPTVKKEAPKASGWQTGDRSFYRGKWWTLRADGWWYADPPPVEVQPAPMYYQPARAFRFFGGGNCGPSG